ncbi:MAG: 23S rRNA-/tRNA-specific pseudouridylate synthase, partial [Lentimonas sp.]
HAAELKVTHPSRDEAMHFQAPLPADFSEVLDQLG